MKQIKGLTYLILLLFAAACDSNDELVFDSDMIIVNEGNYTTAEGSLSGYDASLDAVQSQVFKNANGFAVTATIQRVETSGDQYVIVTNAPDKLFLVDEAFNLQADIDEDLNSPYSFEIAGDMGFVTNWGTFNEATFAYDNPSLSIIDMSDFTIIDDIDWAYQPQDLQVVGDKLYITNVNASSISVMNILTQQVIDEIETPYGPDKMELDANGDMWVICTSGSLLKIDMDTDEVVTTLEDVTASGFNEKMVFDENRETLYYLATVYDAEWNATTTIFKLDVNEEALNPETVVQGTSFYGLGVRDGLLYVANHNNFQGNGAMEIYNMNGERLNIYEVGVAPNGFIFLNE